MLDARSGDSGVETVADLVTIVGVEWAAQEGRHVLGFARMNRGPREPVVDALKVVPATKDDVGCVFSLVDAPVIRDAQVGDPRNVAANKGIEFASLRCKV